MADKLLKYDVAMKSTKTVWQMETPICYTGDENTVTFDFNIIDLEEADLVGVIPNVYLYMRDGSFFQKGPADGVEITGTTVNYTMKGNEGKHSGIAKAQLVLVWDDEVNPPEKLTSQMYAFEVVSGLENKVAVEVMIQDWTTLTREARTFIDTSADEVDALKGELQTAITTANTSLGEFDVALQNGIVATNIAAELQNLEATYAPDLVAVKQQLEQKASKNEVTNVMTPKGSIAYASLPTTGNTVGWYYYCPDGDGTNGAGNYVWNGAVWYFGGNSDNGYNMLLNKVNKNISNLKSGYETLDAYATFKQGRITGGVFLTDMKYRVATDDIIQFDRDVLLNIANGFQITFNIYVNGVFSNPTVYYTGSYTIPKNTQFKILIIRVAENTAELANVNEFVNAVTFSSLIEEKIGNVAYSNSDVFGFVNDYYIDKLGVVKSYATGGTWKYSENYLKIDDVDSFSMTGQAGASSISYYDANLNFVGNEVVSDADVSKMISSFANKPVDAVYFRVSLYVPTENTFKVVFKDLKKIVQSLNGDFLDFKTDLQASVLTSEWKGKKCGFIGDSITFGVGSTKPFSTYLAEKLGIIPYNYGQNGATMHGMEGQVSSLRSEHPDVDAIFIFGGTNDYNSDTPLGTFYTESDATVNVNGVNVTRKLKTIPTSNFATFCDRLNKILYLTKTNFPNAKVILMTPLHRGYATFGTSNVQPPEVYANGLGLYIEDYVDKVIEASSRWSCSLINLFRDSGLYPVSSAYSQFFSNASTDMLHPNAAGHAILAKVIEGELRRINV